MTKLVITGIPPWDGAYDLDPDRPFNTREWRWIKQISGYMPLTISEGFGGGDPDLFVALAVIAMNRDGRISREQGIDVAMQLAEAPFDGATITFDSGEEADADLPLEPTSDPDRSSKIGSTENRSISGLSSTNVSGLSDVSLPRTSALKSLT